MIIGIDLGTTYSCVSYYNNGNVIVIPNEFGNRITPSYVTILDDEIIVGDISKQNMQKYPKHTIYNIKRFIGRKYSDNEIQSDIKMVGYNIVDNNGDIGVKIDNKIFTPEEISSFILKKLRTIAETYLGEIILKAVVTVPAYFNDTQRRATKFAGELAGLDIVRIINEPTSAAMAYGLMDNKNEKVMVFDLGGGTLDVTLLHLDGDIFEVIATSGDPHLGGEDIDNKLVIHCLKEFIRQSKFKFNDLYNDDKVMQKLKIACENAKKVLSSDNKTTIYIDCLYKDTDFSLLITRNKLEQLCSNEFDRCLKPINQILLDSSIGRDDIDNIVLVGGSTRIPRIINILGEYFGKKPINNINPDETVSCGAAIQAGIIANTLDRDIILMDVCPLDIGIETEKGIMVPIIKRNTKIPCTEEKIFTTIYHNQPNITLNVYEGNYGLVKLNKLLGSYKIEGLPIAKKGDIKIVIKFHLNFNGVLDLHIDNGGELSCDAQLVSTTNKNSININDSLSDLDKYVKELIKSKKELLDYLNAIDKDEEIIEIIEWANNYRLDINDIMKKKDNIYLEKKEYVMKKIEKKN